MKNRTSIWKWIGRIAIALAALLVIVVAAAWVYDMAASSQAVRRYPPPGEFVTVDGAQMHYICQGEQVPALVLVHGYAGGAIDWLPLMGALPPDHRVCAFDRFDASYSDAHPLQDRSMPQVVDDLHAALTQLGIEQPVVVGHSLGGGIVQLYAAKYSVAGVVSVDGLSADVADEVVQRMGSYASLSVPARVGLLRPMASSFVSPAYSGELKEQMIALRSRSEAIVGFADEGTQAHAGLDTQALLDAENAMSAPLLIIAAGATDVPEGERFAESLAALADRYPHATYHVIPGAPHYVMATHSADVAKLVSDWLEDLKSGHTVE